MSKVVRFKRWNNLNKAHKAFVVTCGSIASILAVTGILFVGHQVDSNVPSYHHVSANHNPIRTEAVMNIEHPNLNEDNANVTTAQKEQFIKKIGIPAEKAFQYKKNFQVLPSIVVAQAIVESAWGQSGLYAKANNVFGVKGTYKGQSENFATKEWNGSQFVTETQSFRKYPSIEASILDHDYLLRNVFIRKNNVMGYKEEAKLLEQKQHRYATDPNYTSTLISVIQTYHLDKLDKAGLK